MRARTSSNFSLIGPPNEELAALGRLKNPYRLIMEKMMSPLFWAVLNRILFIFAGNDNIHESLDKFEPLVSMVTDRVMMGKTVSPLFLGCFSSVPFHNCR